MGAYINKRVLGGRCAGVFASVLCLVVLAGCNIDDMDGHAVSQPETDEVKFNNAFVGSNDEVETRAQTSVYDLRNTEYGGCDFYMYVSGKKDKTADGPGSDYLTWSTYEVPSGYQGTLIPRPDADGKRDYLKWHARNTDHYFWGWSMKRTMYDFKLPESDGDIPPTKIPIEFKGSTMDETNSSASWLTNTAENPRWRNGEDLERMIGTVAGPRMFNQDGMYVPLQFRHMVSKIFTNQIYLANNQTGESKVVKGTITIYGMPQEAYIHATPINADGSARMPYIGKENGSTEWDYDQTKGVTYVINNTYKSFSGDQSSYYYYNCWYICPELDFSKLSFKIEVYEYKNNQWILSTDIGKYGAYYGDFKNVKFTRSKTESGYDAPVDSEGNNTDLTTLHAGEYMILTITLSSNGNPSVQGTIASWGSSPVDRTGNSHVEQGIYGLEQVNEMNSIMGSTTNTDEQQRKRDEFFELYGSGRTTKDDDKDVYPDYKDKNGDSRDLNIFELYDDIGADGYYCYNPSTHSHSVNSNEKLKTGISPGDGYILDGKGHTINVYTSEPSSKPRTTVTIGPGTVRDVYLRLYYYQDSSSPYTYYEYIVYIDKNGDVWTVDPETFEETKVEGANVNQPNKSSVTVNLETGKVS